jgi:hypothetical protein
MPRTRVVGPPPQAMAHWPLPPSPPVLVICTPISFGSQRPSPELRWVPPLLPHFDEFPTLRNFPPMRQPLTSLLFSRWCRSRWGHWWLPECFTAMPTLFHRLTVATPPRWVSTVVSSPDGYVLPCWWSPRKLNHLLAIVGPPVSAPPCSSCAWWPRTGTPVPRWSAWATEAVGWARLRSPPQPVGPPSVTGRQPTSVRAWAGLSPVLFIYFLFQFWIWYSFKYFWNPFKLLKFIKFCTNIRKMQNKFCWIPCEQTYPMDLANLLVSPYFLV